MVRLPDISELLSALIAAPSISSTRKELDHGNGQVIGLLEEWLSSLNFATEVQPVPGAPGKYNLIATLGGKKSAPDQGLVLAGHTDTVPFDEGRWQFDPFSVTEKDGKLYGLGTSDMKSFFALVIEAVRDLRARDLRRPLTIIATADEETTMAGAKALAATGRPLGRYAIIGEPTSLKPVHVHKGILMDAIHLMGRSGHSSDPDAGVNALDAMYRVMGALMAWRAELAKNHTDDRFKVPVPTLNLGHIQGGDNPNRICGECELHVDLRPLPGMVIDDLREDLRERVKQAVEGSPLVVSFTTLFDGVPPMETPLDSPVVQAAEEETGQQASAVTFGTEGPFLSALGMDTLILGPGDLEQAHQPDEFLRIDRIDPTITLLQKMISRFCTN